MSDLFGNHIVGFPTRRLMMQIPVLEQLTMAQNDLWKFVPRHCYLLILSGLFVLICSGCLYMTSVKYNIMFQWEK